MEWVNRMNMAIRYIEDHLCDEIDIEELARLTCTSTYHFQRMFAYMSDVSLATYIRRRKMSLAAVDLQGHQEKIIDVALRYGYSSPTSFNRAFQKVQGFPPSALRNPGMTIKAYPPISFKLSIKGTQELSFRIEKKPAFRTIGYQYAITRDMEMNFRNVPQLWEQAESNHLIAELLTKKMYLQDGVFGINIYEKDWSYMLAVASLAKVSSQMSEYQVPACTWAIFSGEGKAPDAIQDLEKRIMTQWFPACGFEYDQGPDLECYYAADPQHTVFEIWIPVKKQKK